MKIINQILCDFGEMIIGRMRLPYTPDKLHIIALIMHATTDDIGAYRQTGRPAGCFGQSVADQGLTDVLRT